MSRRKAELRAKLIAMAQQEDSPEEAAVARAKLASLDLRDDEEFLPPAVVRARWEAYQRQQAHEADEREREALLKRWERGTFSGIRIRAGAGGIDTGYR